MLRKSDICILAAVAFSFLLSVYLWFGGDREAGLFVGLWVPSIIGIGLYFKILVLRERGHDR